MKEYQEVIKDRYDLESEEALAQSIYSEHHPIGKYSRKIIFSGLSEFVAWYLEKRGSLTDQHMLDLGCGGGEILSFFEGQGFGPSKLMGIDLSENRILRAQRTFPSIEFKCSDALNFDLDARKFEIITAFDLYSHLSSADQIIAGLKTVSKHLTDDGLFLWYDIYAKDHFNSGQSVDSSGFSQAQMIELASAVGMTPIYSKSFFKLFFGRYHSLYQAQRVPHSLLRWLEIVLPGKPGNLMLVFQKQN